MQRYRIASLGLPRVTLIVGLMLTLPWAGGCSSEGPVITERVVPPDRPGGASESLVAKPQMPKKGRSSRPVMKSIKGRVGADEVN